METTGTCQFSCFIIGEGSLPIQCAEILLDRGHEICGIISPDVPINRWAEGKNIPHADPSDALIAFLRHRPFDYLFSIVNRSILPKEVLGLPGRLAINYHDALLPCYAGSFATSWAIMNRETTHGVTWHVMSELVDGGDILRQCTIDMAEQETAITLNAKCYEAAIFSFEELIDDLSLGRVSRRKQCSKERTFSPRNKRPSAAGVLSWNWSGNKIDAFVRALDFGPYDNSLGLPKVAIGPDFVIVGRTQVLGSPSVAPPGTITEIDKNFIQISVADSEIHLQNLMTINGHALSISEAVTEFGLYKGYRFSQLDPELEERISSFNASICKHEVYWVKQLSALRPVRLPYSVSNLTPERKATYQTVSVPLPKEVQAFADATTPEGRCTFLSAAFLAYLARVTGVSSFDVGFISPGLRRDLKGLEGIFSLQVPLHVDVNSRRRFSSFFLDVQKQVEVVRQHRTYARDIAARYPALRSAGQRPGKTTLPITVEWTRDLEDFEELPGSEFTFLVSTEKAECHWVFDAQTLETNSVTRMLAQFRVMLQDIVKKPDKCIAELAVLTAEEYQRLLVEFNDTSLNYPEDQCIHQLFELQVERTPHATALVYGDQELTYQELNCRANQVAHRLRALGARPEVLIAICMERSPELVVEILGILKSGAAYLPLDPAYPEERRTLILKDAQARLLVSDRLSAGCFSNSSARVVCVDTEWQTVAEESKANPGIPVSSRNLAYVIYTSGSTGKPKGVAIEHRSAVSLLSWAKTLYTAKDLSRVLASTSICFDLSVFELFCPLTSGGRVVLVKDALALPSLPPNTGVTLVNTVPSAIAELLRVDNGLPPSVRTVNLAGEPLSNAVVQQLYRRETVRQVFDLYGPSEDTTYSTCALRMHAGPATIGRPISNKQIYILDRNLQPVPLGIPGELYIGGDGLARGYLNRPELTSEKFTPDPFSNRPGARLYQTGDMARYLPDGNLEFLGRLDHQVKIRGFRIECGEIEAVLESHPAVGDAVVVAREDKAQKCLVAYVVPTHRQTVSIGDLRTFLKQKLPDFMVPSAFALLESLPLTPNGKIDRRALPVDDLASPESNNVYVSPQSELEQSIVKIWQEVLSVEKVGTQDNFFDLGGHSLLMVEVNQQLKNVIGRNVPIVQMFRYPTVRALAKSLSQDPAVQPSLQQSASRGQTRRESIVRRQMPRQAVRSQQNI